MRRVEQALALVGRIEAAPSVSAAFDLFEQAMEPFGVSVYRASPLPSRLAEPVPEAVATNWSERWTRHYMGERLWLYDPTLKALRNNQPSFFWRDLPPADTPQGRQLMRDAAAEGMADGFAVVRQISADMKTAVYMAGSSLPWDPLETGVAAFIGNTLITRFLQLRDVADSPPVQRLSDREAQVLQLAARGLSDKEIAQALQIAFRTVRYHWASINRKLGAVDRCNAVAVGLWTGQIAT